MCLCLPRGADPPSAGLGGPTALCLPRGDDPPRPPPACHPLGPASPAVAAGMAGALPRVGAGSPVAFPRVGAGSPVALPRVGQGSARPPGVGVGGPWPCLGWVGPDPSLLGWLDGKRARASLRTGVRPVGNGIDLRCLLGARAPPGSNPLPSRGLRSSPLPCCAWHKRTNWPSPDTTRSGRLTAPAGWPGAGLPRNLPSIAAMSTRRDLLRSCCDQRCGGLFPLVLRRYD